MISAPLRLCAVLLLLLAGCSTAPDEAIPPPPEQTAGGGAPDIAMGDTAGAGAPDIASSDLPPGVEPGSQEDLDITVGDRVYFEFDSAVITPTAADTLDKQAAWLHRYPDVTVTVEGHADERGTREYNLALGDRRANAVRNYLVALEVDPERILTISYGEERPAVPGNDEEAWAENRRAVTVVNTTN